MVSNVEDSIGIGGKEKLVDVDLAEAVTALKRNTKAGWRKVVPLGTQYLTSTSRLERRRDAIEKKRQKAGAAHVITYFHDVTDPYSHILAQKLGALAHTYDVELRPMLVSPPADDVVADRAKLMAYSLKDVTDVAPYYDLDFKTGKTMPAPEAFALAGRLLSAAIARSSFDVDAPRIGAALWSNDEALMEVIKGELPMADQKLFDKHIKQGDKERERKGHYLGSVLSYGGECYFGLDRLHHLEERLLDLGLRNSFAAPHLIAPRKTERRETPMIKAPHVSLEFFFSLSCPFSYLAMERTLSLAKQYELRFVLRPIMPDLGEDEAKPAAKRRYMKFDAKREAQAENLTYGKVCSPEGDPAARACSLYAWAASQGREQDFALSFLRGTFAEGLDGGTDGGMKKIVEAAGLDWSLAETHLDSESWREPMQANQTYMSELGLWGTPSYRVSADGFEEDFTAWGQDRLWLVEEEIKKRR